MKKSESRELIIRKEKAKRNLALTVGGLLLASEMILIAFNLAPVRLCILLSIPTVPILYLALRSHSRLSLPSEIDSLLESTEKSVDSKSVPVTEKEKQEAEISALEAKQQKSLKRLAALLGIVIVSSLVGMIMNVMSVEVCKYIGFAASAVFVNAAHTYRRRVERLQMALKRQVLPPNINKLDLIRRCETFESEMSAGSTPSVNPYSLVYDNPQLPASRFRELNHELLKCLRNVDQTNLLEIQQMLTSSRSTADVTLFVSTTLLIGSAIAFTQTVGLGFDSIPNLFVMGIGSITFVVIIGALIVTMMDNQNLRCLELWLTEFAKEEPKAKLTDSLFD